MASVWQNQPKYTGDKGCRQTVSAAYWLIMCEAIRPGFPNRCLAESQADLDRTDIRSSEGSSVREDHNVTVLDYSAALGPSVYPIWISTENKVQHIRPLTGDEKKVLNKGLKFAPNSGPNRFETYIDLHKAMGDSLVQTTEATVKRFIRHNKSNFFPKESQGEYLQIFHKIVVQEDFNMILERSNKIRNNLNRKEREALH
ncbi:hypothetical protein XELAEV_18037647mg [Xenopus laevis]|uniref:Uncharacterized protein n=1 Tax=Xenopus laevis TaxID=8355 RepID=A0A974CD79_XENLA|nr:hypothetical protein XELAEV_18037647mg [Xenopus laevis]